MIQLALCGGEGSIPAVGLDALGAAAHQLVDDMEDQQVQCLPFATFMTAMHLCCH